MKRNEILKQILAAEAAHKQNINNLKHEAYKAWVEEGGKEKDELDRQLERARHKSKYKTSNGLTVHNLRQAGVEVSISHIRYIELEGSNDLIPVPSYLRKMYDFYPRGGATHIALVKPDGSWMGVSSVCHVTDSFDYKLGVKVALDQISNDEAADLLAGLEAIAEDEEEDTVVLAGPEGDIGCSCVGACGTCE